MLAAKQCLVNDAPTFGAFERQRAFSDLLQLRLTSSDLLQRSFAKYGVRNLADPFQGTGNRQILLVDLLVMSDCKRQIDCMIARVSPDMRPT